MKKYLWLIVTTFVLFSCGNKSMHLYEGNVKSESFSGVATEEVMQNAAPSELQKQEDFGGSSPNIDIERKVIKTGNIAFETSNPQKTKELINRLVKQFNGWIANEGIDRYDNRITYTMSIRVPSQYFEAIIDSISKKGKKIDQKNLLSQDVTEEFIDIEARLATKKSLEGRYLELLKKANKVEEMLSIEREIGSLRSDIESIEGRYKYLKNSVSYSSLDIRYYENSTQNFGFLARVGEALRKGWEGVLYFTLAIVNAWAAIILAIVLIFIFMRIIKKYKARKTSKNG